MIYSPNVNLMAAPLVVPASYVGLTSMIAPVVGVGFSFSTVASLGYNRYVNAGGSLTLNELLVKYINPSAGVYNWTIFDRLMSNNPGKQLQFLLGFPADYLVSTATVGGASFGGKSNMAPTDLVTYAAVITAIVGRAKNTWGITGARWTIWGEWDTTGDYAGTIPQLVGVAKATYQAIKAIDSTAIVISPSLDSALSGNALLTTYLATSDGSGGTGLTWCDAVAMHFYQPYLPDTPAQYEFTIRRLREANGYAKPVFLEECGILASDPNAGINHARRLFIFAALGVQGYVGFSVDDPVEGYQISGYQTQWNYAANALIGSPTMSGCWINPNGTVTAVLNGTQYTI